MSGITVNDEAHLYDRYNATEGDFHQNHHGALIMTTAIAAAVITVVIVL